MFHLQVYFTYPPTAGGGLRWARHSRHLSAPQLPPCQGHLCSLPPQRHLPVRVGLDIFYSSILSALLTVCLSSAFMVSVVTPGLALCIFHVSEPR